MSFLRHLITEAHRRSLWQVLGIYVVAAWIGYEVILALTEGIGLPAWVPGFAVVIFIIGLPIVLATAFVQEGPPLPRGLQTADRHAHARAGPEGEAAPGDSRPGPDPSEAGRSGVGGSGAGGSGVEGEARARPGPRTGARLLTWRRAATAGVLAFALLGVAASGYMGLGAMGVGPAATLVSSGLLEEREMVVLADLDAGDPALGEVVTEALRIDLHESPVLTLADAAYVADVLRRMERDPSRPLTGEAAREVAVREGLKAVIAGNIRRLGDAYVLTADIRSAPDGAVLAFFREDAEGENELLPAVDRLAADIREKVGESLRSIRGAEPLEEVTTRSLPALRLYSRAEKVYDATGDAARAAEILERALAEDSTFAMAWRKLGVRLVNQGRDILGQREAFSRAYELRDRLPQTERYLAEADYHDYVQLDEEEAARAYRTLLELRPDHTIALNNLALIYGGLDRREEAVDLFRRAAELEPIPVHVTNLAFALARVGRIDAADSALTRARREWPGYLAALGMTAGLAGIRNDFERADSVAREIGRRFPEGEGPLESLVLQGSIDLTRGRLAEGTAHTQEALQYAMRHGFYGHASDLLARLVDVQLVHRADTAAAVALISRMGAQPSLHELPPELLFRTYAAFHFARAGEMERMDSLRAVADSMGEFEALPAAPAMRQRIREEWSARYAAYRALAEGPPDSAVTAFRRLRSLLECGHCFRFEIGTAYERAQQPDSVIAVWTRAVGETTLGRLNAQAVWRPYILRRLGELHDARGDTAAAVRFYDELLELWSDPDPELRPVVDGVRDRVRRLTATGPG